MLVERNRRGLPYLGNARCDVFTEEASRRVQQVALVRRSHRAITHKIKGHIMSTTNLESTPSYRAERVTTQETRPARKTTEFIAYVAAVLAVVVTAFVVGADDNGVDAFGAAQALQYVTFLTIGYMVARGLAKSGSRNRYDDNA
jgi:hypothetical protein